MTDKPRKWCFVKGFSSNFGPILIPDMEMDREALSSIGQGERVQITIRQWRNNDRLRSYWALLNQCIDACGLDMPSDTLSQVIKLETGYVDLVKLPGYGDMIRIPRSISFEKMTEDDFVAFYRSAEKWLAETYGFVNERELT
jgi:hypothetical protein